MGGYIYRITNIINNRSYIGQTIEKNPYRRINRHFEENINYKSYIKNAIKKYGKNHFKVEILFYAFNITNLNEIEKYLINYYNTRFPNGYNLKAGGNQGGSLSLELKKKLSIKIKEWYKNNKHPFFGKEFSKKHRNNLSKARKGVPKTQRQLEARRNSIVLNKPIIAINIETNLVKEFSSIAECAKLLNLNASCISRVCRNDNNRKQHKGWKFIFKKLDKKKKKG